MASFRARARRVAFPERTDSFSSGRESISKSPSRQSTSSDISDVVAETKTRPHQRRTHHVQRLPQHARLESFVDALERDGCVVIEGFSTISTLTQSQDEVKEILESQQKVSGLAKSSKTLRDSVLMQPTYLSIVDSFLTLRTTSWHNDESVTSTIQPRLSSVEAKTLPPSSASSATLPPSRDGSIFSRKDSHTHAVHESATHYVAERDSMLGLIVPLPTTTASSDQLQQGFIRVIPGSHLWGDEKPHISEGGGIIDIELKPGDAVVVLGSLYWAYAESGRSDQKTLCEIWSLAGVYRSEEQIDGSTYPEALVKSWSKGLKERLGLLGKS